MVAYPGVFFGAKNPILTLFLQKEINARSPHGQFYNIFELHFEVAMLFPTKKMSRMNIFAQSNIRAKESKNQRTQWTNRQRRTHLNKDRTEKREVFSSTKKKTKIIFLQNYSENPNDIVKSFFSFSETPVFISTKIILCTCPRCCRQSNNYSQNMAHCWYKTCDFNSKYIDDYFVAAVDFQVS